MPQNIELDEIPGQIDPPWAFLKPLARSQGLAAIGVTPAGPVESRAADRFREWLAQGHHASMHYMTRHLAQRFDPTHSKMLTDAHVVVSAALGYGAGAVDFGLWRYVAAHARSMDYHLVLKQRLGVIARGIESRYPGCRYRVFVDTAPLMERTWALQARLGHLGRNGALIVSGVGGRVVLGEILLVGVPIPPAASPPPLFASCGECDACVKACPSGALGESGIVDSRLCLSFHSIENRQGPIPPALAALMTLLFGCDRCTEVCPLERAEAPCALEPPPTPGPDSITLEEIARTDESTLRSWLVNTALLRTGAKVLRRNAHHLLARQDAGKSRMS